MAILLLVAMIVDNINEHAYYRTAMSVANTISNDPIITARRAQHRYHNDIIIL